MASAQRFTHSGNRLARQVQQRRRVQVPSRTDTRVQLAKRGGHSSSIPCQPGRWPPLDHFPIACRSKHHPLPGRTLGYFFSLAGAGDATALDDDSGWHRPGAFTDKAHRSLMAAGSVSRASAVTGRRGSSRQACRGQAGLQLVAAAQVVSPHRRPRQAVLDQVAPIPVPVARCRDQQQPCGRGSRCAGRRRRRA